MTHVQPAAGAPRRRPGYDPAADRQSVPRRQPGAHAEPLPRGEPGAHERPLPRRQPRGHPEAVTGDPAGTAALGLRDQALAALGGGDPQAAIGLARGGLALLAGAGLNDGPDEAELLVTLAEIEESLGRLGDAAATIATAITLLGGDARPAGG